MARVEEEPQAGPSTVEGAPDERPPKHKGKVRIECKQKVNFWCSFTNVHAIASLHSYIFRSAKLNCTMQHTIYI